MTRRRRIVLSVLVLLYLCTGIFGWQSHASELEAQAQRHWQGQAQMITQGKANGLPDGPLIRQGGPYTKVNWCFPVLPGVLLADSDYVIGPMNGKGGVKIVLFYGFGSVEICTLWGWIS